MNILTAAEWNRHIRNWMKLAAFAARTELLIEAGVDPFGNGGAGIRQEQPETEKPS